MKIFLDFLPIVLFFLTFNQAEKRPDEAAALANDCEHMAARGWSKAATRRAERGWLRRVRCGHASGASFERRQQHWHSQSRAPPKKRKGEPKRGSKKAAEG